MRMIVQLGYVNSGPFCVDVLKGCHVQSYGANILYILCLVEVMLSVGL
jgi:hypothetical protein